MQKKILLIDYEPRSVERVRTLLSSPDFALVEARDGEEGLTAFASSRFDAVILAGILPKMPTAEVIREIRRKGGAIAPPILLMVSGYKGNNPKADAQRVGAFEILAKPFTDEQFHAALKDALDSTDIGARTMRIPTAAMAAPPSLTSSDIFSDVLEEVGGQAAAPSPPPPPARPATSTAEEVEKRLRDTLSGILPGKTAAKPAAPPAVPPPPTPAASSPAEPPSVPPASDAPSPASPPAPAVPRFSTDADIERMISDTLSGIRATRAREASGAPAPPEEKPGSAPSISNSGPDRFGQYEILERIASGGMAELYKARRSGVEGFQKIVAIKKILPHLADNDEFITMFADEAKLAAQLNHPNIVHIFDLGKIESGGYFIAMEFVEGRDLRAILKSGREIGQPLPVPLSIYIACKVAAALDYAHRRRESDGRELKIVHRDVSPQNILISYEGDIKLCDFGIAKAASKASQTESGALKGKVRYMSPEQAWGKPIDRRSDLFSLGAVLFEMLTDQVLFRGDTDLTVLEKVRAAEVVAPSSINPEVPRNLDAIVLKALAREPDDRYANASDMLRDLEAALYAHTPAPGSADLAIYLHRLQAEEAAAAEARAREAARAIAPEPERKRKSKVTPVARRGTGSTPKLAVASTAEAAPATPPARELTPPGVFGASAPPEAERRSRAPLYAAIAAACVALAVVAWWVSRKPAPRASVPVAAATPLPTEAPAAAAPVPTAVSAPAPAPGAVLNAKAIEEEVQRQLAARRKELQKSLEASSKPAAREAAPTAAPAVSTKKIEPPAVEPTVVAAAPAPSPRLEPTAVPVAVAVVEPAPAVAPPPVPAVEREAEVVRGELVGPGPGVVEPSLLAPPRVAYPALVRERRVPGGRVVVLVLVREDGTVGEARLQQGVPSKPLNEAVVQGVRSAHFRPATKNGIPVKMWRTVVVDARP